MKYFCYISDSKINNLYSQLNEGMINETKVTREVGSEAGLETSDKASLLSLLGIEVKFGAEGRLQYAQSKKVQLAQKLKKVLEILEKNHELFDIKNVLRETNDANYFYYSGLFYFDESPLFNIDEHGYVDGIAIVSSDLNKNYRRLSEYQLKLACSASNFSDTRSNGKYQLNSGNYHFFHNSSKIKFETVFIKNEVHYETNTIYGSPLFLALESRDGKII